MKKPVAIIFSFFILIWAVVFVLQSFGYRMDNSDIIAATQMSGTEDYYAVLNSNDNILIVRANSSGKAKKVIAETGKHFEDDMVMLDTIDITNDGDELYYLTRGYDEDYDACYKITVANTGLAAQQYIIADVFDSDINPSTIYVDDTNIYITAINDERTTCYVYSRALDAEDTDSFSIITQATISDNRFILKALYNGSTVQAYLDSGNYVYFQNGEAQYLDDISCELSERDDLLENIDLKVGAMLTFITCSWAVIVQYLFTCLISAAIFSACYLMYISRRYTFRQMALYEGGLIVLHLLVFIVYTTSFKSYANDCYLDNVSITMEYLDQRYSMDNAYFLNSTDYYATDDYAQAYSDLAEFWAKSRSVEQLYLVHIDGSNKLVLVSLNMDRNTAAEYVGTDDFMKLATAAKISGNVENMTGTFMGNDCALYVVPLTNDASITKYIFAVVRTDSYDQQMVHMRHVLSWYNLITVIICSLIAYYYSIVMTNDIKHFSRVMMTTDEDLLTIKRPKTSTREIEYMWNALTELLKRYEKLNYAKLLLMEAYYRFSPRKMEEIMQKESIMDVKVGDVSEIEATMATIFLPNRSKMSDDDYAKCINEEFKLIGIHQNENDGVMISMNYDLTQLRMLFMNDSARALDFALHATTDLAEYDSKNVPTIFLHQGRMIYGILGSDEQAFPYSRSREMDELAMVVERLSSFHGGVFLTDTLSVTKDLAHGYRFIGNIRLDDKGRTTKLYQSIDVYGATVRTRFIANNTIFEQAMDLFEKKDYYRARNLFSQVIKTNEADEVARWYIFTCEELMEANGN